MVITGLVIMEVIMDLVIMGTTGCRVTGIGHGLITVGTTARIRDTGGTAIKHQIQSAGIDNFKKQRQD